MKANELFEAYVPPVKNKKLGFRADAKIPVGGTKEWMKAFGAMDEHFDQARRVIKQTAEYRAVLASGLKDESTERHVKNGSFMFIGSLSVSALHRRATSRRQKITVQANGKIDETAPNDFHRAPMASKKPHIVPGDPVKSIVKTVCASLQKVADNQALRKKKAEAAVKKAAKA
jgi:hypothetical protein